ncbi:hypothetical protein LCGC14_3001890, partial [marine sediment metagenome]
MRKLKVRRFLNEPGYCTIAASACVANYYDKNIDDNYAKEITVKKITKDMKLGLDSGEVGIL